MRCWPRTGTASCTRRGTKHPSSALIAPGAAEPGTGPCSPRGRHRSGTPNTSRRCRCRAENPPAAIPAASAPARSRRPHAPPDSGCTGTQGSSTRSRCRAAGRRHPRSAGPGSRLGPVPATDDGTGTTVHRAPPGDPRVRFARARRQPGQRGEDRGDLRLRRPQNVFDHRLKPTRRGRRPSAPGRAHSSPHAQPWRDQGTTVGRRGTTGKGWWCATATTRS